MDDVPLNIVEPNIRADSAPPGKKRWPESRPF
jgi:hypothetical protein